MSFGGLNIQPLLDAVHEGWVELENLIKPDSTGGVHVGPPRGK